MSEPITINAPMMACDCGGLDYQFIQDTEEVDLSGEIIPIDVEYFKCLDCGEEMEASHPDYLADAYAEYKRRTGKEWKGEGRAT